MWPVRIAFTYDITGSTKKHVDVSCVKCGEDLFFKRHQCSQWIASHWKRIGNQTEPLVWLFTRPMGRTCLRLHLVVHNRMFPQESTRGQDNTLRVEELRWWGWSAEGPGGGCFPRLNVLELYLCCSW